MKQSLKMDQMSILVHIDLNCFTAFLGKVPVMFIFHYHQVDISKAITVTVKAFHQLELYAPHGVESALV